MCSTTAVLRCDVMCRAVCRLGLRTEGAAWAMTCCTFTNALLLTCYQTYRDKVMLAGKPECTWRGYSMAAFRGWWQYLSLGVPAAAMICLVRGLIDGAADWPLGAQLRIGPALSAQAGNSLSLTVMQCMLQPLMGCATQEGIEPPEAHSGCDMLPLLLFHSASVCWLLLAVCRSGGCGS